MRLLSSAETNLKEAGEGTYLRPVAFRHAVAKLRKLLPGGSDSNILGRFYVKEVDVVVSDWRRGPDDKLRMPTFFSNILDAVMTNTPVDIHQELRRRRLGEEPPGGFPPPEDDVMPDAASPLDDKPWEA